MRIAYRKYDLGALGRGLLAVALGLLESPGGVTPRRESERQPTESKQLLLHPGGDLGRRLTWTVRDVMITDSDRVPALGPEADLLIDANSCYGPKRAIEVGRMLEDHGYCHFEEPCPYWELEQTKEVTDALSIDITGGEQDCDLTVWKRMIDMRAVDIVQPDICYLGGIARTLRVCRMADAAGIPITPHCANLSMVTLFTMHLLRAISHAGKYLEFSIEGADYYPWQEGLFVESPYVIENGFASSGSPLYMTVAAAEAVRCPSFEWIDPGATSGVGSRSPRYAASIGGSG